MSLADRAAGRLLEAGQAGFMDSWMRLDPPHFQREFMRQQWFNRANWRPCKWSLEFCVYPSDSDFAMGRVEAVAEEFCAIRSVRTTSWLLPEARGQGLGLEARKAMLYFLFEGLGAEEAKAEIHPHNLASLRIAEQLGYIDDGGEMVIGGDGLPYRNKRMVLPRSRWESPQGFEIFNLDSALCMFGLTLSPDSELPVPTDSMMRAGPPGAPVPGWSLFDAKSPIDLESDPVVPVATPIQGPAI